MLSNWTRHAFEELNSQVQQALQMALQQHLVLDMLKLNRVHVACKV